MDDRKRAWQLLYNAICRHAGREVDGNGQTDAESAIGEADSEVDLIIQLAGFGATLAFFGRDQEHTMSIVDSLNESVMHEQDGGPPSI